MTKRMMTEAEAERAERNWRARHFKGMTEEARAAHAESRPVYGEVSSKAEREGSTAVAELLVEYLPIMSQWFEGQVLDHRPRKGCSPPDAPYVKSQRYPRRKAARAWITFLKTGKLSTADIVTVEDRQRRAEARDIKARVRLVAERAATPEGRAELRAMAAGMRKAKAARGQVVIG